MIPRNNAIEFTELDPSDRRWTRALEHAPHDIYHRPEYVALEAKRVGARPAAGYVEWGDGALLVPYLVRNVGDDSQTYDAASPYGYSGALLVGESGGTMLREAVDLLWHGMRELGYCTLFLRMHPILDDANAGFTPDVLHLTGPTVVVDLAKTAEELWQSLKKEARRSVRRAREAGLEVSIGSPVGEPLDELASIYHETMRYVGAAPHYYSFDLDYFQALQNKLGEYLSLVAVVSNGATVCASLNSISGTIAQRMLGGTRVSARPLKPSVLELYESLQAYRETGVRFVNLGGGVGSKRDSLLRFKQNFSEVTRPFYTLRVVLDKPNYTALVRDRARITGTTEEQLIGSDFFPAYRAPA